MNGSYSELHMISQKITIITVFESESCGNFNEKKEHVSTNTKMSKTNGFTNPFIDIE